MRGNSQVRFLREGAVVRPLPLPDETLEGGSGTVNPYLYNGRFGYHNDWTNRYSVRRRHLRTDIGRWPSRDPIGFYGGDANLYGYVGNRPINLVDPSGLAAESAKCCVCGKPVFRSGGNITAMDQPMLPPHTPHVDLANLTLFNLTFWYNDPQVAIEQNPPQPWDFHLDFQDFTNAGLFTAKSKKYFWEAMLAGILIFIEFHVKNPDSCELIVTESGTNKLIRYPDGLTDYTVPFSNVVTITKAIQSFKTGYAMLSAPLAKPDADGCTDMLVYVDAPTNVANFQLMSRRNMDGQPLQNPAHVFTKNLKQTVEIRNVSDTTSAGPPVDWSAEFGIHLDRTPFGGANQN